MKLSRVLILCCAILANHALGQKGAANALINEQSPYLLQHAYNPVDWYPWGQEALDKAQKENKLVIISIGYASCHWCHVMEDECFEDSTVAQTMNEHFVSIKVDREERPDIDQLYMDAAKLIIGQGGWPLNIIALPDGKPFFAGTYFEKDKWLNVLDYITKAKTADPGRINKAANDIFNGIQKQNFVPQGSANVEYTAELLKLPYEQLITRVDFEAGGLKGAPKFPKPILWEWILETERSNVGDRSLESFTQALNRMGKGGIFDAASGGFARYSTDDQWRRKARG